MPLAILLDMLRFPSQEAKALSYAPRQHAHGRVKSNFALVDAKLAEQPQCL